MLCSVKMAGRHSTDWPEASSVSGPDVENEVNSCDSCELLPNGAIDKGDSGRQRYDSAGDPSPHDELCT